MDINVELAKKIAEYMNGTFKDNEVKIEFNEDQKIQATQLSMISSQFKPIKVSCYEGYIEIKVPEATFLDLRLIVVDLDLQLKNRILKYDPIETICLKISDVMDNYIKNHSKLLPLQAEYVNKLYELLTKDIIDVNISKQHVIDLK